MPEKMLLLCRDKTKLYNGREGTKHSETGLRCASLRGILNAIIELT